jgi:hypothetical protein
VNGESEELVSADQLKENDAVYFSFEFFTAEAIKEYEKLLEMIADDAQSGALEKYDSDYGSYIETYGNVKKTLVEPDEQAWGTGSLPEIHLTFKQSTLCSMLDCSPETLEVTLDDYDWNELMTQLLGDLSEEIDADFLDYEIDVDNITLSFSTGTGLLCYGTFGELKQNYGLYKKAADTISSAGGNLEYAQESDYAAPGTLLWVSDAGFNELTLDMSTGEFKMCTYSL